MIEDYFKNITILEITEGPDDLGGHITSYKKLGVVKGILTRSSSVERLIAAQRGISDSYIFQTKPIDNHGIVIDKDTILQCDGITARINSSELKGESESNVMADISQWTAESYVMVEGAKTV